MTEVSDAGQHNDAESHPALEYVKIHLIEALQRFQKIQQRNVRILRQRPWQEISGAFGDLGTLFPIFVALADRGSISVSSTLVFSGLANICTGIFFGIPLPVQPMKAIAAVAIANEYSQPQLASAGLFVGAVIGLLSVIGLVQWFTQWIPLPIIKGIQVGTGLSLIISSNAFFPGLGLTVYWHDYVTLAAVLAFLFFCSVYPRSPFVLVFIALCVPPVLADVWNSSSYGPHWSFWSPIPFIPSFKDFRFGAINAGLGQIPLTTLNSIIAVTHLSADLIPDVSTPSATAVGISVSTMNLFACWFGAMPICHGSGGLASQYRFGARSGASVAILGIIKLLLGLFMAEFALLYCHKFFRVPLGIMLFIAGLELAKMGESLNTDGARDLWEKPDNEHPAAHRTRTLTREEKMRRWMVMFVTVGALLAAKNDGIGFLSGLLVHGAYKMLDVFNFWRSQNEGRLRLENETPSRPDNMPDRLYVEP